MTTSAVSSRYVSLVAVALPLIANGQTAGQAEYFEKNVRPVFAKSCQSCHNAKVKSAGLDLTSAQGFLQGGQSGPLLDRENPGNSRLLKATSYDEKLKMPPTGKLKAEELAALANWVGMGAPWPGAAQTETARPKSSGRALTDADRNFWAFRPVVKPAEPAVRNESLVRTPVDRFILSKIEEKGLEAAAPANKLALLRRATYDLTGLPPTDKEIAGFLADNSPTAFDKVVDRLLGSPRYGEHWGRHWLDVARYADSTGNDEDHRYPYAWRYRDYVIAAFNEDKPYDQFVREQIAGDLLPAADGSAMNRTGIVATGFLALGAKALAQQDKKKMLYDIYDEQVDVVSKSFLALSLACARCHDHKFDPLLTRDYYSLVSIFANTRNFKDSVSHVSKLLYTPLVPKEQYEAYQRHQDLLNSKKMEIEDIAEEEVSRYNQELAPRLAEYMLAAAEVLKGGKSQGAGLKADLIEKWASLLKRKDYVPPHLEKWMSAKPEQLPAVAREYQADYEKHLKEWTEKLAKWRENTRRMLKEMNMPPPPKPRFEPEHGPFFHAVYFGKGPFAVPEKERDGVFSAEARQRIAAVNRQIEELKKNAPPEPDLACSVEEGEPVEQRVFIRGDYSSLGEPVSKAFPQVISRPDDPKVTRGSGRLELARWLTRPDHPLTARVMVNRIWHWHFGDGIVRTPDNFGKMGERPTHPELLDYLAARFVEGGWSIKSMHRLIMLSNAYRMSTAASEANLKADPEYRLFSRYPRRRLTVEELRDGLLAIDGTLDLTMGGTLQKGFGTDSENSNDRLSLNPEKVQRRMVYLPLRRANLPSLLNLFDFGDATTTNGKRVVTNVAPQALFAMNSEFVAERSKRLASQLLTDPQVSDAARLERAYLRTVNRKPAAEEIDASLSYLSSFEKRFGGEAARSKAWSSFCRILLASNEFIYVD
ncbi:MAG: PSD1 and planctomycete cytochrome C domain-containing protein [Bryobacteraceae bacterium]